MSTASAVKVAVIGGGYGALATAFELTRPEHGGRFAVTVYQMGWRLGGKGASGRNNAIENRTEEHGLHVLMGFYENTFRLIRECYTELAEARAADPAIPKALFEKWDEAIFPDPWVGVADCLHGSWRTWMSHFPATPGLPGDPFDPDTNPFTLRNYLTRGVVLLRALMHSTFSASGRSTGAPPNQQLDFSEVSPRAIVDKIASLVRTGILTTVSGLYEATAILHVVLSGRFSLPQGDYKVLQFAEAIADNVKRQAAEIVAIDPDLRPKFELVELVVAVIVGILRDQLLSDPAGLDAVNDEDCRTWLRRHGASERACQSPVVRALYQMAFAEHPLHNGDTPGLAAGQALRGAFRMFFTYRGCLFWKLRAGMGDVVFAPLYLLLKQRGVKFEFFHQLVDIGLGSASDKRPCVETLKFKVQAAVGAASDLRLAPFSQKLGAEYYPLDDDGCWPCLPIGKFNDSARRFEDPFDPTDGSPKTLERGSHFDCVVLAIGLGAIPHCCRSLLEQDANWRAMVDNVKTAATQALQLWTTVPIAGELAPAPAPITVAGFKGPFDTWSDMTHVVPWEGWGNPAPNGLAYFCGMLPDPPPEQDGREFQPGERPYPIDLAAARGTVVDYVDRALPQLWPRALNDDTGEFRWNVLAINHRAPPLRRDPPLTREEKLRLVETQYYTANIHPSDRYVLSRPGTLQYRISPLDETYSNLTIAGDWTDCGFNEGCVEAAVMSGMLAAHSLNCSPRLEDIVGFDHP